MSKCKSCGADIRFMRTEGGAMMPIDVEPNEKGNLVIDGNKVAFAKENTPRYRPRYQSHFVSCPNADEHRSRR